MQINNNITKMGIYYFLGPYTRTVSTLVSQQQIFLDEKQLYIYVWQCSVNKDDFHCKFIKYNTYNCREAQ